MNVNIELIKGSVIDIKSGITINFSPSHIWNLATCICGNWKYLTSIFDDSVITCKKLETHNLDQTTKKQKHFQQNFSKKSRLSNTKLQYLILIFINYYRITNNLLAFTVIW